MSARQTAITDFDALLGLIGTVIGELAGAADDTLDQSINRTLAAIGEFVQVDRSYLFSVCEAYCCNTHEWCAQGIEPQIDKLRALPLSDIAWWLPRLRTGNIVYIPDVSALPEERQAERVVLEPQGIRSLLVVPLRSNGQLRGFLGFDAVRDHRAWCVATRHLLQCVADAILAAQRRQDATQALRRSEAELRHRVHHDELTGLLNRAGLLRALQAACRMATRCGARLGVLLLDLDKFKLVNNAYGHALGDELLAAVAERLAHALPAGASLARLGGDEFAVILPGDAAQLAEIRAQAAALLACVNEDVTLQGRALRLRCSAGLTLNDGGAQPLDLLRDADAALYQAKLRGGGQLVHFDAVLSRQLMDRVRIIDALRGAITRDELSLVYQPFFHTETGALAGVEALLRWHHPELGTISPGVFIPMAEEAGLIVDLGSWVLEHALEEFASWRRQCAATAGLTLAVNVSAHQLRGDDLRGRIHRALARLELEPSNLCLELTEHTLVHESSADIEQLRLLRAEGLDIAMDDFGTGYSSLAGLCDLPLSHLKIDRSFIAGLDAGEGSSGSKARIVSVIIVLAGDLRLKTIAEGVETPAQLRALKDLGSDYVQGFHLMRPAPAEEILQLIVRSLDTGDSLVNCPAIN